VNGKYSSSHWGPWPSLFARRLQSFCQLLYMYVAATHILHVSKQACSKEGEGWGGLLLETTLRCPPAPAPRSTEVLILALDRGLALFVFTCIVCRLVFVRNTRAHTSTRNSQLAHAHTDTQHRFFTAMTWILYVEFVT